MFAELRKTLEDRCSRMTADPADEIIADLDRRITELRAKRSALLDERQALDCWHASLHAESRDGMTAQAQAMAARYEGRHPGRLPTLVTETEEQLADVEVELRQLRATRSQMQADIQGKKAEALRPTYDVTVERIATVLSTLQGFVDDERRIRVEMSGHEELVDMELSSGILKVKTWVERQQSGGHPWLKEIASQDRADAEARAAIERVMAERDRSHG